MDPIIQVEDLTFGYTGELFLRDVAFAVMPGEFVGIIGANGTGKSTLLKLLLGELEPQRGSIRLWGQAAHHFRDWPRIGYVPQSSAATAAGFPASALEVVTANLYASVGPMRLPGKQHRQAALQALAAVGLEDCARSRIGELSGGQLQRVMLARALVAKPRALLLDEPASGVDSASADGMYLLLQRLNGEGITVVMVTHDLSRAAGFLGRALCLEHGTMVELDREQMAHELEHRHKHP